MRYRYLRPSLSLPSLPEMLQSDLYIKYAVDARLNTVITLCESARDQGHSRGAAEMSAAPDRKWAINKLSQAALRKAVQQWLRERRSLATPRNSFRPSKRWTIIFISARSDISCSVMALQMRT